MKTTRFFLFLIVLSVLWCADVFAHDYGNPIAHFSPGDADDPCSKLRDKRNCGPYDEEGNLRPEYVGGHGHIKDELTAGYWTADNNPGGSPNQPSSTSSTTTTTSTPTSSTTTTTTTTTTATTPTSSTTTTTSLVATTLSKISGDGQQGSVGQPLANPFVVEVQDQNGNPLQGTTVIFAVTAGGGTLSIITATTDANGQVQTTLTLGPMLGTNTVQAGAPGIDQRQVFSAEATLTESVRAAVADTTDSAPEAVQLYQFELQLQQGWNLIHLPLTVYGVGNQLSRIQTAADLYTLIQPYTMFIYSGGRFFTVNAETDIMIEPNQGIVLFASAPATFTLIGTRLPSEFQLERGLNFVGMPRQSVTLQRVSDLSRIYEEAVTVITAVAGRFYVVGRAGDSGDHKLTGGQSFFIFTTASRETFFYGPAWGTRIE